MKHGLLPLLAAALACPLQVAQADTYKFWCGKKYNATAPSFAGYNIGAPMAKYDLPHGSEFHGIKVVQGVLPYEATDINVTLVAYVPQGVFTEHEGMNVTISVPALGATAVVGPEQAVAGVSFPGDASDLLVGKNRLSADVSYARFENGTGFSDYLSTIFFDFWVVDAPARAQGQSLVALHTLDQGVSVDGGEPFYPVGYYVDNSYMFSGDYAAAEAAVREYASEGYNVLMHSGPIGSNATQMQWTLELCQKYGLYYQCDVTDMTGNLTALSLLVSDFASVYSSFLSYYIGNEPDGDVGIGSLEPTQSKTAHEFLRITDPFHPATLVTNCAHSMPSFDGHGDFVMTDIYAVGIPTEYNGVQCNATQGCCGCDLCDGANPVRSVLDRYAGIRADLGVQFPSVWFVEQTFYDNTSYWSRPPTYQEELAMAWASVVSGGAGVLGYTWPVTGVPTAYPQLGLALSDFAAQMFSSNSSSSGLGLARDTVLSGPRVSHGSIGTVYYASWATGTVVALNTDYNNTAGFAAVAEDLGLSASGGGSITGLSLGRSSSSGSSSWTSRVSVQGGLLIDQLLPLEIKVYRQ